MHGRCLCAVRRSKKRGWCRQSLTGLRGIFNLSVLLAFVALVIVYLFVVNQVEEHLRLVHNSDLTWNGVIEYPLTYCQFRKNNKAALEAGGDGAGDMYESLKHNTEQLCIHPELDPCDQSVATFDHYVSPVNCSGAEENWVYVENGTFRISSAARKKHGLIVCEYAPIVRGKGDFTARHGEHIKPMLDKTPLVSDFFKVACMAPSGKRYHNIHTGVAYNATLHERSTSVPLPRSALGYNVFMLGFDSTSRNSWLRNLPRSRDFFIREMAGIELEGYNIVGDGTVQALLPILTGKTESDLHPARRGYPGAREIDDFPWIWNNFRNSGYVTAWGEDMSYIGTFQLRLHGFKEQPTDHSMRTYFMLAEPMYKKFLPWCIGSEARHVRFLKWFKDLFEMYRESPTFMFGFHSELSHNNINELKKVMDKDLLEFLKHLHFNGYFDNTILILMGDHGLRISDFRDTPQGKLEERMPYFAFRLPPSFAKSYPEEYGHFVNNVRRLTTPFDVHETFHHMLNMSGAPVDHTKSRGISLFRKISKARSCDDAGVEPHWCACLQWTSVKNYALSTKLSQIVASYINDLTSKVRAQCAFLRVTEVIGVSKVEINENLLKFKKSKDIHGDIPDLSDVMRVDSDQFQITLVTEPGSGQFEVTLKHSTLNDTFTVTESQISRINRYGSAPACIEKRFPHLRPYCYCLQ
ncbi:unnamed protein product [Lymnaea stagnalis]|uniref:Uncharacterized protein n=1 Tax=Lymnaea stagnalis TaxID=6523 RepID=A0AAV2I5A3_LYMST